MDHRQLMAAAVLHAEDVSGLQHGGVSRPGPAHSHRVVAGGRGTQMLEAASVSSTVSSTASLSPGRERVWCSKGAGSVMKREVELFLKD